MFKYFVVSAVFMPVVFGLLGAASPDLEVARRTLRRRWWMFGVFWIAMLYFLRYRWQ